METEFNTQKLPAVAQTVAQYMATMLAGWMIRHGYITADDEQLVLGAVIALVAAALGVYKTIKHKNDVKRAALAQPADVVLK